VFCACISIHLPYESSLLNASRRLGIPTVGIINSWDNVHKGIDSHPDIALVWNSVNENELITMEGYERKVIKQIGVLNFQQFFNDDNIWSREEVCEKMGLDPLRPIWMYASIGQYVAFFEETFLLDELIKLSLAYSPGKDRRLSAGFIHGQRENCLKTMKIILKSFSRRSRITFLH